jgi:phage terminase large subunit-like protein
MQGGMLVMKPTPHVFPLLLGRECYAGLDLASTTDLCALGLVFPIEESGLVAVKPLFWCPENCGRERERRNKVRYDRWIKQGYIKTTPGDVIDYEVIRRDMNDLSKQHHIREVAIDRWNATQLSTQLSDDGFNVIGFGQGYASMNAPTKEFESLVLSHRLIHDGNPVLRWMVSNLSTEMDAAGNLKPSKKKSTEKIDGCVAIIMGLGRWIANSGSGGMVTL